MQRSNSDDPYAVGGGLEPAEAARRQRVRLIVGGAMLFSGVLLLGISYYLFHQARTPQPLVPVDGSSTFAPPPPTGLPIVPLAVGVFGFFDLVAGLLVMAFGLPGLNRAAGSGAGADTGRPRRRQADAAKPQRERARQAQAAQVATGVSAVSGGMRAPAKLGNLLVGGVFMLVGLGICLGGVWSYTSTKAFIARAIRVPGEVVALDSHRDSDGDTMYSPVYEYDDLQGQHHKVTSSQSSHPAAFDVGEKVEVLYEPDDPEESEIDSFTQLWLLPTFLIPFGAIFFLIGAVASGIPGLVFRRLRGVGAGAQGAELTPRLPAGADSEGESEASNPYASTEAPVKPEDEGGSEAKR